MLQTVHFVAAQKRRETDKIERRMNASRNRTTSEPKRITQKPFNEVSVYPGASSENSCTAKTDQIKRKLCMGTFLASSLVQRRIFCEGACKLQSRFYFSLRTWNCESKENATSSVMFAIAICFSVVSENTEKLIQA